MNQMWMQLEMKKKPVILFQKKGEKEVSKRKSYTMKTSFSVYL